MSGAFVKYSILFLLFGKLLQAQVSSDDNGNNAYANSVIKNSPMNLNQQVHMPAIKNLSKQPEAIKSPIQDLPHYVIPHEPNNRKSRFNIVSSFRQNIRFGGFWDRYAIINFTPSVNIKPFDFMSIYANQHLSCYVPISGIKEHFKSLFIQGAAILAIDNSFNLLFGPDKMVQSIIEFALKNIITSVMEPKIDKQSANKVFSYNSYYYSMSIRF